MIMKSDETGFFGIEARLQKAGAWLYGEFDRRSRVALNFLQRAMGGIVSGWITLGLLAAALKVTFAPAHTESASMAMAMSLPFLMFVAAPVVSYRLAMAVVPVKGEPVQPLIGLRWRAADEGEWQSAAAKGASGFLISLMIGLLINVPVRGAEFLAVVPAIRPQAPHWAQVLSFVMTADVVLMSTAYMACFVLALRLNRWFPHLLLVAWCLDLLMQAAIGTVLTQAHMPEALLEPLHDFLEGNVKKVLISVLLWLPYLLVSDQVNLFYRHRVRRAQPCGAML